MGYLFEIEADVARVEPEYGETEIRLRIDQSLYSASLFAGDERGEAILEIDERVWLATKGDVHFVHLRGRAHRVVAINALERARREAAPTGGDEILRAPMPGVVVDIAAQAGDRVTRGQLLMTIESMKLQTAINAPHDAQVAEICVVAGASFDQDAALVRLEPAHADATADATDDATDDDASNPVEPRENAQ